MMKRFGFFFFLIWASFCTATFDEALEEFAEGDYERTRTILAQSGFIDNIRARLYLLASQEFTPIPMTGPTKAGLKALIEEADTNPRHKDYMAARLTRAFWHIYSENAAPATVAAPWRTDEHQALLNGIHVTRYDGNGSSTTDEEPPQGGDRLRQAEESRPTADSILLSTYGVVLEHVDLQDLEEVVHHSVHFPVEDLFEENPAVDQGVLILREIAESRNTHGLYFLGNYVYNLQGHYRKATGLGLITAAAHLENATAKTLIDRFMGMDRREGWINNCKMWFCCGASGTKRFYCGEDQHGKWWICSMGLCGCRTRWSMGELCFNVQNVSRQTLGGLGFFFGMGLVLTQQLAQNELIDISDNWESFIGWMGMFLASGGFGVSHSKKAD